MIPLTQLGLTDPAVPNESEQSSSFTSSLYLPPTPRQLMQSVRGSDNDDCDIECEVKTVVKCTESPVASGTVTDNGPQPPTTQEAGFVTPKNDVNVNVTRGVKHCAGFTCDQKGVYRHPTRSRQKVSQRTATGCGAAA